MTFQFTFRPLTWLGPITENRRSRYTFKAGWSDTLNLLERELDYLGAERAYVEADFREQDITVSGMPRANSRQPTFPGIRITFDSIHGELRYQTDSCDFWQHNVRSIALGLEALRAVDRYGITARAEQYQGYLAIEARSMGAPTPPKFASPEVALEFLRSPEVTGLEDASRLTARRAWHAAITEHHPDKHGESDLWGDILDAKAVVEKAGLF